MTEYEQRIAIAEACGWVINDGWEHPTLEGDRLPDYHYDLDAMREAEQLIWSKDWNARDVFIDELAKILEPKSGYRMQRAIDFLDVTARQRAEALWETIVKLKEMEME